MATKTTYYEFVKPADNETADIGVINGDMDLIDTALHTVDETATAASTKAAALETSKGNADVQMLTNTQVAASSWVSDTTYESFPFRAAITAGGCTASHRPDVTFSVDDATGGNFAPVAESYAGGFYIYAKEKPEAAITIPTIAIWKAR